MQDDEILARVVTDSLCLSSWKEANQGKTIKRCRTMWRPTRSLSAMNSAAKSSPSAKSGSISFSRPALCDSGQPAAAGSPDCPGYSFPWIGGEATHVVIPNEVMAQDCLLTWEGDTWFEGSLVEPLSCVIGAFNANYHLQEGAITM
jgi:hypothetical protein